MMERQLQSHVHFIATCSMCRGSRREQFSCIVALIAGHFAQWQSKPIKRRSSRRIGFSLDLSEERVVLDVDPTRFVQVISNLLDNALKYTDPGGQIRIAPS